MKTTFRNGFSLVELVVAILIIGILAAVAIPKYFSVQTDARIAAVKSLAMVVTAAENDAVQRCIAQAGCYGSGVTYSLGINGGYYQMWNGYPDAGDSIGNNEIDVLVNAPSVFTVSIANPITYWQISAAPNPALCAVQYQEAASFTSPPTITSYTSGC